MNKNTDIDTIIHETIIVEGRDDISAVKKAVNADIIATHGYGIAKETFDRIRYAYETKGIIILTDPDSAGNRIRRRLTDMFPDALQAYISREDARAGDDIGVENAPPDVILKALRAAGGTSGKRHTEYSMRDMIDYGLAGGMDSSRFRDALGRMFGIGYGNAKAFMKRLNDYGIIREDLEKALDEIRTV